MKIEYSDGTYHNVDCYRFCRAILENGKEVFFIEYKDYSNNRDGDYTDSYAIIACNDGVWHKVNEKINYSVLASHIVQEYNPEILGKKLNFYRENKSNVIDNFNKKSATIQTQTQVKRQEKPPFKNNEEQFFTNISDNSEYYQTQTQTQREEIPPKNRNEKENEKNIYVVLPTIGGKGQIIDFNTLHSLDKPFTGFIVTKFIINDDLKKTQLSVYDKSYSDDFKVYNHIELNDDTIQKILKNLDKQGATIQNINELKDLTIGNCRYQFVPSNDRMYRMSLNYQLETVVLPFKKGYDDIKSKDMLRRFMLNTALGYLKMPYINYVELIPILNEENKAELFSLMAEYYKLKSIANTNNTEYNEYNEYSEDIAIPKDSYDLETTISKLKTENLLLTKSLLISNKQLSEAEKRQKQTNELKAFCNFFASIGADTNGLSQIIEQNDENYRKNRK